MNQSFAYHSVKAFHGDFGWKLEEPFEEVDQRNLQVVAVREIASHMQLIDNDDRNLPKRNVFADLNKLIDHFYPILLRIPQQFP